MAKLTPAEIKENIGKNTKALRDRRGMTRSDLARLIELDHMTLYGLESGGSMTVPTVVAIADALNVSIDDLVKGNFEPLHRVTMEELRREMSLNGHTPNHISRLTGVQAMTLSRFLTGKTKKVSEANNKRLLKYMGMEMGDDGEQE